MGVGPGDPGLGSSAGAPLRLGLRARRRGLRPLVENLRAAGGARAALRREGQLLGDGGDRAVRPVQRDLRRPPPGAPGGRLGDGHRLGPLPGDLEPGVHAVRARRGGEDDAAAAAVDRHRRRPRAGCRGARRGGFELRHRPVPADPGRRRDAGRDGLRPRRRSRRLAARGRRPPARGRLPARRRRHPLERGTRLRAAPPAAPGGPPRHAPGFRRAVPLAPAAGGRRGDGRRLPGARRDPRRLAGDGAHRGGEVPGHGRDRLADGPGGDRGDAREGRDAAAGRGHLPPLRHLRPADPAPARDRRGGEVRPRRSRLRGRPRRAAPALPRCRRRRHGLGEDDPGSGRGTRRLERDGSDAVRRLPETFHGRGEAALGLPLRLRRSGDGSPRRRSRPAEGRRPRRSRPRPNGLLRRIRRPGRRPRRDPLGGRPRPGGRNPEGQRRPDPPPGDRARR